MTKRLTTHVQTRFDEIDLTSNEPEARLINRQIQSLRREKFKQDREGRSLQFTPFRDWLQGVDGQPILVMLDGNFINSTIVNKLGMRLDFNKLRDNLPMVRTPINYYCLYHSQKLLSFLNYLTTVEGYNVHAKECKQFQDGDRLINSGSVAAQITTDMFMAFDDDQDLEHVLLFSRDADLIHPIKALKQWNGRFSLAVLNDVPVTAGLLNEVEHLLDIADIITALDCATPRDVK